MPDWYYTQQKQQRGPVPFEELIALTASSQVEQTELVWTQGMAEWMPASNIPELAAAVPPLDALAAAAAPTAQVYAPGYGAPYVQGALLNYQTPNYYDGVRRFQYAGFWIRFGAVLIDGIILQVAQGILNAIIYAIDGSAVSSSFVNGLVRPGGFRFQGTGLIVTLLMMMIQWLYFAFSESSLKGATLGKRLCGLRVVDLQGERISFGRATGRFFGSILSQVVCYIGYLVGASGDRNQTWHDMMAGTICIKV